MSFIIENGQVAPPTFEFYGAAFVGGSVIMLARIEDSAGTALTQSDISAAKYTIYELDLYDPASVTAISGHEDVSLVVSDVMHNSLQTDELWQVDGTGYNFRHDLDVSSDDAFVKAGVSYQVRHELTPSSGQKIVLRYRVWVR